MIEEERLKAILKETYLEIANTYDVSGLKHDSDKVACVASKFRCTVLDRLDEDKAFETTGKLAFS